MPAYLDMTAANFALKELYDGQQVEKMMYMNNPFLAMVPKKEDFGGKYYPIPLITGASQGASNTFTTAQANQFAPSGQEFLLTSKTDYSIATIDRRTLLSANTDKMAFLRTAKLNIDGAIITSRNRWAGMLFRSGTGSRGRILTSSGITSGVITLNDPQTVTQFEQGQTLQANSTDGGTPRSTLGYVISVNRVAGTVTVSATAQGGTAGTPVGWIDGDFLLQQGDNNLSISGLPAWLPTTDPTTSDSFYGVNRSADRTRLAGINYTGSAQSIEEAIIDCSNLLSREDGNPTHFFTNFGTYSALVKSQGTRIQYVDASVGTVGFKGVRLATSNGYVDTFPDRSCPGNTGYLLQMDTWMLCTLGKAPDVFRDGGADDQGLLRVYNADAAELRAGGYGNLGCNAPGRNAVITFSA